MDSWKQIDSDFIEWDNSTHSNASQRQILDWFKERFRLDLTDADIEAWAEAQDETSCISGAIIGAKAMRDNEIPHIKK